MDIDAQGREIIPIQEMIWSVYMPQWQIRRIAPSVRFTREKGDSLAIFRGGDKGWKVFRQTGQGQLVHNPMPFVIPTQEIELAQKQDPDRAPGLEKANVHK